ncbi:MAG: S41 family peptidase [Chitinophagaceae bacterium]
MRNITFLILFLSLCTGVTAQNDSANSTKYFSRQQVMDDMQYMHRKMEEVHPNLYHSISQQQYLHLMDSLGASLKDSATAKEVWPLFARMIAAINEGHTMLGNTAQEAVDIKEKGYPLFPLTFKSFDGTHLVVREDVSADSILLNGDKVVAINGIPAQKIMALFTADYGGLQNWKELNALQDFISAMYRHQITPPYRVTYIRNGAQKEVVYAGTPYAEFLQRLQAMRKAVAGQRAAPYTFEKMQDNIGYLNLRTFGTDYDKFNEFLEATFTDIKKDNIKGLVIDLRENGGGNSALGNRLLHFITAKPYRMSGGVRWKVSQPYKDHLYRLDSAKRASYAYYTGKENGSFISGEEAAKAPPANDLRFNGPVCVLIGANTFSSANMLAVTIKDFNLATLIGEPTGEPGNDYGETLTLTLSHTAIPFSTSTKHFVRPNGDMADNGAIQPHIYVKEERSSTGDAAKDFALEWIQQQAAKKPKGK